MNRISKLVQYGQHIIRRDRGFSLVNIFGLSLGIFFFLLTALYVKDEVTHDQWHSKGKQIYLPKQSMAANGMSVMLMPSYAIGQGWVDESPGVLDYTNISYAQTLTYKIGEREFETKKFFYTNSGLFRVFDFGLKLGDEATALEEPDGLVISSEMANKHFGTDNPLGQILDFGASGTYKVTGVLNPIPSNSHLQFEMLAPIRFDLGPYQGLETNWQFGSGLHYLLIQEGYDLEKLEEETNAMVTKHRGEGPALEFSFEPFEELYLGGGTVRTAEGMFAGQRKYLIIFSITGFLMLLVASFNYINLTTARSFSRARDFAVRKVMGASKGQIIRLQLVETVLISLVAMVIAIIALEMSLPGINGLIGKSLSLNVSIQPEIILIPAAVLLIVVLISGIYPAIIGSQFSIASALKGNQPKSRGNLIRRVLIVMQFVICAGVLSSSLIIRSQADFLIKKDLGYNSKNVLNVRLMGEGQSDRYDELKAELERSPMLEGVAAAPIPTSYGLMFMEVGEGAEKTNQMISYGTADIGFVEMFELAMVSGKDFASSTETEREKGILINEAALEFTEHDKESIIGEKLEGMESPVLGVLKDFHFSSTKNKIGPLMVRYAPGEFGSINLKYRNGEEEQVIAHLLAVWDQFEFKDAPEYKVVEHYFDNTLERENLLVSIFDVLTIALVLVSALGLFALAVLESQLKQKEMSIRKVLGANTLNLLQKLNQRFMWLIVIALVVSVPITQLLIGNWLQAFPYRIESTYSFFALSSMVVLLMALLMLTIQGLMRLRENPADVLRNE